MLQFISSIFHIIVDAITTIFTIIVEIPLRISQIYGYINVIIPDFIAIILLVMVSVLVVIHVKRLVLG